MQSVKEYQSRGYVKVIQFSNWGLLLCLLIGGLPAIIFMVPSLIASLLHHADSKKRIRAAKLHLKQLHKSR